MILLNPRGGLCNRLRVIGSAIKLGADYNDSIMVFWRKSSELGCAFGDLFENIVYNNEKGTFIIKDIEDSEDELFQKIIGRIGNKKVYNDTPADIEKFLEDYVCRKGKGIFLLSTCSCFYDFSNKYDWLLPNKEIMEKVTYIAQTFGGNCIGIHIRRTDHEISKIFSTNELFINIMDEEIKKNGSVKFYLATDDIETKKIFLEKYGEKIITNRNGSLNRENKEGMLSAVIDLYALSKTQKIYGSWYSSFSETASFIGNIMAEYVYKPLKKLSNKKVVIYGAGQLGQAVYWMYFNMCDIVGWVDQNYRQISDATGRTVSSPQAVLKLNFDYIVLAAKENKVKEDMKQLLLDLNINQDKIIDEL